MQIKLKPLAFAVMALSLPLTATANLSLNHAGYMQTTGGVVNEGSVHSSSFNPAGNNLLIDSDEKFRFGYLSNLGLSVEIGEVENLDTKLDYIQDALEKDANGRYDTSLFDEVGNIINDLERAGQLKINAQVQAPLTPFLFRSSLANGTFSLNASVGAQIRASVIGAPVNAGLELKSGSNSLGIDIDLAKAAGAYREIEDLLLNQSNLGANDAPALLSILDKYGLTEAAQAIREDANFENASNITFDDANAAIKTDAGVDIRAARIAHLGLGYGTDLSNLFNFSRTHGVLEGGIRANLYNVEMGRNFISLQVAANDDEDISDSLTEDFFDNTETSTNLGLDLGFLWHSDHYQAGITFYNLNEPSFDYPDLGKFVDSATSDVLNNLEQSGRTKTKDKVTLSRHAILEAAYFTKNRNWMLQGSYTLGTATNFVGDEYRNLHLAAGYYSKSSFIPGIRLGYSKNLTGSELSKVHLGSTFFGIFNLDLAVATNTSKYDDTSIPRYLAVSLGFEEKF